MMSSRFTARESLLADEGLRCLLRAATRQDDEGLRAFQAWRRDNALDSAGAAGFLVLPSLVELLDRHGVADRDLARMRGVGRYVWAANALRLKAFLKAIDVLAAASIRTVLMKSAAIFARSPAASHRRLPADHDILVEPARIGDAATALREAGFVPKGFTWEDVPGQLVSSCTPGMPIALPREAGEIDLHWRPLPTIPDAALTESVFSAAETRVFHGRTVLVPSTAHHLFISLARCEPWDENECFRRLLEGALLLGIPGSRPDWAALEALIRRHGTAAAAAAYLGTLAEDCDCDVPQGLVCGLHASVSRRGAEAWRLRHIKPGQRNPFQERRILREAMRHHAPADGVAAPSQAEALLRRFGEGSPAAVALVWHLACRRVTGASTGAPRFLEGFSFPEADGRWTGARWALLALPLVAADDGRLALVGHAYLGARAGVRLLLSAGAGTTILRLAPGDDAPLCFAARPVARIGGDALVVLHMPDATSPHAEGESMDDRLLGFFLRRAWRG